MDMDDNKSCEDEYADFLSKDNRNVGYVISSISIKGSYPTALNNKQQQYNRS